MSSRLFMMLPVFDRGWRREKYLSSYLFNQKMLKLMLLNRTPGPLLVHRRQCDTFSAAFSMAPIILNSLQKCLQLSPITGENYFPQRGYFRPIFHCDEESINYPLTASIAWLKHRSIER